MNNHIWDVPVLWNASHAGNLQRVLVRVSHEKNPPTFHEILDG